jgi:Animal haem peroxidase
MFKPQTVIPGRGGFFPMFDLPPTIFNADVLQRLGKAMGAVVIPGDSSCDSGYVYLGQFITHDITKRASLPANEFVPASELVQQRTPALDLDNVYGDGFRDVRIGVDTLTGKMLLGRVVDSSNRPGSEDDLPRNADLTPRIGDDRDDENLLIAQLHVQFLQLHNLFVDRIREKMPELQAEELFNEARRNLRSPRSKCGASSNFATGANVVGGGEGGSRSRIRSCYRGCLRGAPGRSRTDTSRGHCVLSAARIPVPPRAPTINRQRWCGRQDSNLQFAELRSLLEESIGLETRFPSDPLK